ncbi:MAG: response regulator [Anaerolineales bacterium]|nr:response regulator [Anaerolineales bacterium]
MTDSVRLLIVEDNEEIAEMLVLFLGARGYKVTLAPDGAAAEQSVRDGLPNLLLLDVGLPDTDGYTLLTRFRHSARTRYIPAIFLTQRNKKADKLSGLQLGADDYITKPFDLEELFLRVQNAVQRAQRESLNDPRTGLPTGRVAREEIDGARGRPGRAILEFRLRGLDVFRDHYGVLAAADLLRYTALVLNGLLNQYGTPDDFLGLPAEETFAVVCAADKAEAYQRAVLEQFNRDAAQHYALGERVGADQVRVKQPDGREALLPIVRLDPARRQ